MNPIEAMGALGGLGMPELLVIGGIAVLLFGGKKIGEMGKGIGEAITGFKSALKEGNEAKDALKSDFANDPAWRDLRDRQRWSELAEYERLHRR